MFGSSVYIVYFGFNIVVYLCGFNGVFCIKNFDSLGLSQRKGDRLGRFFQQLVYPCVVFFGNRAKEWLDYVWFILLDCPGNGKETGMISPKLGACHCVVFFGKRAKEWLALCSLHGVSYTSTSFKHEFCIYFIIVI